MGLDMYFTADFYNGGGYNFRKNTPEEESFNAILKVLNIPREVAGTSIDISVNVGYLRKANAIHNWLVNNIQGGKDECQRSYFSHEKVEELRDICRQILATVDMGEPVMQTSPYNHNHSFETHPNVTLDEELARRLLEPAEGFFFGSTDMDEWYVEDLRTADTFLTNMLEHPAFEYASFYYRASW